MKENTKIIISCTITLILGTIINVTATTLLQANSISYKTSNGETIDVNSALDRLFDVADINDRLGSNDISSIGDGTITGAVNSLNYNLETKQNEPELIWTNPDTTSIFTSQTITLDKILSDYTYIEIILGNKGVKNNFSEVYKYYVEDNVQGNLTHTDWVSAQYIDSRRFTIDLDNNQLLFNGAYRNGSSNDNVAIPYYIYGIK